jgi:hypothetical protein
MLIRTRSLTGCPETRSTTPQSRVGRSCQRIIIGKLNPHLEASSHGRVKCAITTSPIVGRTARQSRERWSILPRRPLPIGNKNYLVNLTFIISTFYIDLSSLCYNHTGESHSICLPWSAECESAKCFALVSFFLTV